MKNISLILYTIFCFTNSACSKKSGGGTPIPNNHPPIATLAATIKSVNPFTVDFKVTASDQDNDPLTYAWDFGEGTTKNGNAVETFTYLENKTFTIKVAVTDGKSSVVNLSTSINTTITDVTINASQKFQTMEGFGGFGAKDVYWSNGPFTSTEFVDDLINDLGLTILRENIPTNFEVVNDNSDPYLTDLTRFNINSNTTGHDGKLADHLQFLKDLKAAGLQKLIVSIWSAAPWMKYNNQVSNGTDQNSAPPYTNSPDANTNQLKTDQYQEFAEMCVAYITIIKQETGFDVYALSLQNEPRFSQFYASCVYDGAALGDIIKVVGKRLDDEGLNTRIFMPEDVGWFDGINALIQPILSDAVAMSYVDIVATHGYAFDGITAASTDAQTWQAMYNWGAPLGKPLWMTETSGFENDMNGAISLGKAMYTAITYGNISAWVFWSLSTGTLDAYCLMSSSGAKSKRYYASKNLYRYVRPGAYRISATAPDHSSIYPLAFKHDTENSQTIVLINDTTITRAVKISGSGLPTQFIMYVTSAADDCKDYGTVNTADGILLPSKSVVTLYKKN